MALRSFSFRYGKSTVSFKLQEDQISTVITGKEVRAIDHLEQAYLHALDHPVDSALCATWSNPVRPWRSRSATSPVSGRKTIKPCRCFWITEQCGSPTRI